MSTFQWVLRGMALAVLLAASVSFAQEPRRIDPGVPQIPDLGAPAEWQTVPITGQAAGSRLGALAIRASDGGVFVWSMHQEPRLVAKVPAIPNFDGVRRIDPGLPQLPGEGGPDGPGLGMTMTVSTLYQWIGGTWVPVLVARDQTGAFVHVGAGGDVYASTDCPDGTIRVYHSYGMGWMLEPLPAGMTGPAGAFAGENAIFMRGGEMIIRHRQHGWTSEYHCGDFPIGGGLAACGNQIVAPCEGHEHMFDGAAWFTNEEPLMTHFHSLWGARDEAGTLHLFAGGSDAEHVQARLFEYVESAPGSLRGEFRIAVETGMGDLPGYFTVVSGDQVHDVYAAGLAGGEGKLYHFNGAGWVSASPEERLPAIMGVGVSPAWGVWISLADGRLLHRPVPGAEPPAVVKESRVPSADRLVVVGGPESRATLQLTLSEPQDVTISIFDLNGRFVDALRPGWLARGVHRLSWDASRVSSGIYFCRTQAGAAVVTRKVLIRR